MPGYTRVLHCSIKSCRFLRFLHCFLLGPRSFRRPPEAPRRLADGSGGPPGGPRTTPGPGSKHLKTNTFCSALLSGRESVPSFVPKYVAALREGLLFCSRIGHRLFWVSGRPRGTRGPFQKVGGEAPHLLEGPPGPLGPSRPPNPQNDRFSILKQSKHFIATQSAATYPLECGGTQDLKPRMSRSSSWLFDTLANFNWYSRVVASEPAREGSTHGQL